MSRRQAEERIREGRVRVNGARAQLGAKVVPGSDEVRLDGALVCAAEVAHVWLLLHKPIGVVTTRRDEKGRRTVMDLLGPEHAHLYPVGRLDTSTSGLLLLTNDGELANRLLHPSRHVEKVYRATVDAPLGPRERARLTSGEIVLDGRPVSPIQLSRLGNRRYQLTLREGRNRQVRRMLEAVGRQVVALHRVRLGSLSLGDLPRGAYRSLTPAEVAALAAEGTP